MRRREFITLLGGAAITPALLRPHIARAQQDSRVRRIGWLVDLDENDPRVREDAAVMREVLAKLGWAEGRNLRIETRFGARDAKRLTSLATELVNSGPEVIVTNGTTATLVLRQKTQTIPIVYATGSTEPVATGLVQSIARPSGNITGFPTYEPSITGKWLELLKDAWPGMSRASLVFNPESTTNTATAMDYLRPAAAALGVAIAETHVGNGVEAVRALDALAGEPRAGVVMMPPPPGIAIREAILQLAIEHRLPLISGYREHAVAGALMSYGSLRADIVRGAANYVDRLLRGTKVSDLPVQFPTKYVLVVNLKTAKAIGLNIPEAFLLRADEVIE
jgi:ABC-type uncharacterized transport system substrate-binding protein